MKKIALSDRLKAVAKYIGQDASVADVGTDHGYIPVYLAQNHMARRIIASDVKKGPLARAVASAEGYGVVDRIEFVQTNGLDGLEGCGIDTVVIAGMGGETIAGILQKASWTKMENMRLILQPQSKLNLLTDWLAQNGIEIKDASLAFDEGRLYTVILAGTGKNAEGRGVIRVLFDKHDPLLPQYLEYLIQKERRALEGLVKSSTQNNCAFDSKKRELEVLRSMKEETDKWQV